MSLHDKPSFKAASHTARIMTTVALVSASLACGQKKGFDMGDELGPAVLGGGGASRSQGTQIIQPNSSGSGSSPIFIKVKKKRLVPKPTYDIVPVTMIVEAVDDRSSWTPATVPFLIAGANDTAKQEKIFAYGSDTFFESATSQTKQARDGAWPFAFAFDYPQNNFQFKEARLVVETQRDNSDTEGIFIEGIFSGRPPSGMVNTSTAAISHHIYQNDGSNTLGTNENRYYIDHSLANYRRDRRNFFDLNLADLLSPTALTPFAAVNDGAVQVVLGDDSPAYKAYLVIEGLTVSSEEMACSLSSSYSFKNTLVHNDGNSIGESAFTDVKPLYDAFNDSPLVHGSEFYFNTVLPDAKLENIELTTAKLFFLKARREASGCPMIVINGIGVSAAHCDRSATTEVVEMWDDSATAAAEWDSFLALVPTNMTGADVELDLIRLFGEESVKSLLKQGKLNVAVGGTLVSTSVKGTTLTGTSARTFQSAIDGPELIFEGTYKIEVCSVANDPDSPMTEDGFVEPPYVEEYEEYEELVQVDPQTGSVSSSDGDDQILNDGSGPVLASIQVQDITSTSATIYWATDEPSSSQIMFGINAPDTATAEDSSLVTFHKVVLNGLSPYKYYKFQVISKDRYGNASSSNVNVFTTLR